MTNSCRAGHGSRSRCQSRDLNPGDCLAGQYISQTLDREEAIAVASSEALLFKAERCYSPEAVLECVARELRRLFVYLKDREPDFESAGVASVSEDGSLPSPLHEVAAEEVATSCQNYETLLFCTYPRYGTLNSNTRIQKPCHLASIPVMVT